MNIPLGRNTSKMFVLFLCLCFFINNGMFLDYKLNIEDYSFLWIFICSFIFCKYILMATFFNPSMLTGIFSFISYDIFLLWWNCIVCLNSGKIMNFELFIFFSFSERDCNNVFCFVFFLVVDIYILFPPFIIVA